MFERILAATDLVNSYDAVVMTGLRIAKQNNGKLYLLHVVESTASKDHPHSVKHSPTDDHIESNLQHAQKLRQGIRKTYTDPFKSFRNYEIRVASGYPFEEILTWAKEISADLIVLGPHSGRAEENGVVRVKGKIGSTAEGVITNEQCPVMIVNQHVLEKRLEFKKLMVSIDFSPSCICALQFAIKVSRNFGSKIFVYHMLPVPPSTQYTHPMYERDVNIARKKLNTVCREMPSEIDVECKAWGGVHPHLEILNYAENKEIDIIVMGSHTKETGGKWYVGSAVERVSYRAMCPVIVITDPEIVLKN